VLCRVVRDHLFQVAGLIRQGDLSVPPRLQEAALASDDEPALAGLKVDHQSLEPVGDDQHFLGFSGAAFQGAQLCN
jgi:hypothetical protein